MAGSLIKSEDGGVKPGIVYGVIGLAVVLGAYWVYASWTGPGKGMTVTMLCYTQDCGYSRDRALELGEILPAKCPRCGNLSVVSAFSCPGCGAPNVWNEDRGLAPPTKCTKCGREVRYGQ
jgi:hypothetical protein